MNNLRYAVRTLLRTPAFTITAALTLALGIGATTAIFSVVNAVLLEPLPYRDPDRLVVTRRLSLPDYEDLRRANQSFEQIAVWASNLYDLRSSDEGRQILGGVISRDLLPTLGITPAVGRNFAEDDEQQKTVILSHGLWESVFGADPRAIGRTLDLSGTTYTVIGVTPPGFRFPNRDFQLWTPMESSMRDAAGQAKNRALRIFSAVSRLKPGVTPAQARAEVEAISSTLAAAHPPTNTDVVFPLATLSERILGDVRTPLLVVLVTVALLLLIACANVANLMLARTTAREREMAIRTALGAGRGRLMAQLAVESLIVAAIGGACGLLLAVWAVDALPALLDARMPHADRIRIDGDVLLFAIAATLLTSLIFGTAPALQVRGQAGALKDGGRTISASPRSRRLRTIIVGGEVALAVLVVVGASLLVRSFLVLTSRDPGFAPHNLLSFNTGLMLLPNERARGSASAAVLDALAALPGVDAVGASTGLPTVTPQRATRLEIEGRQLAPEESNALFMAATRDFFTTVGTPVLGGRPIDRTDTAGSQPVVVINQTMAATLFAGEDPLGRRIRLLFPEYSSEWRTVVGVVGDLRYQGFENDLAPAVYTPFEQTPFLWMYVMVRTSADPASMAQTIRRTVRTVNPNLTASNLRQMTDVVSGTVSEPRFGMLLVSGFAVLALLLAAVGIYGVIAYSVSQRTHEIGLRMALGAKRGDVVRMVLRESMAITVVGIAVGLAASALATRLMIDLLVAITPTDPIAFTAGALLLLALALAASYLPARRATRVDPMVALRTN